MTSRKQVKDLRCVSATVKSDEQDSRLMRRPLKRKLWEGVLSRLRSKSVDLS